MGSQRKAKVRTSPWVRSDRITIIRSDSDDTFVTVGFFIDPNTSQVSYFIGEAEPVGVVNTNLPDDEELTVSFGIQNGEAAAKTMTIDYVNVICER